MPGGYQLGHALDLVRGAILGVGFLWALVAFVLWICGLQVLAFLLGFTGRIYVVQWVLRVVLLVKATPVAALSGMMLYVSLLPSESESTARQFEAWTTFVYCVLWFAFIPCICVAISNVAWIASRLVRKLIRACGWDRAAPT